MEHQFSHRTVRIPVCIFAKPPVPGRVKTRLAGAVGDKYAAELAAAMLHDIWSVVVSARGAMPVLAAAEDGSFALDVPQDRVWLQHGADLGSRIEGILQRALEIAPAAIALGADTPLLTAHHLAEAMEQLESGNAVLGPCDDGGFYLLGLRSCPGGVLASHPLELRAHLRRNGIAPQVQRNESRPDPHLLRYRHAGRTCGDFGANWKVCRRKSRLERENGWRHSDGQHHSSSAERSIANQRHSTCLAGHGRGEGNPGCGRRQRR